MVEVQLLQRRAAHAVRDAEEARAAGAHGCRRSHTSMSSGRASKGSLSSLAPSASAVASAAASRWRSVRRRGGCVCVWERRGWARCTCSRPLAHCAARPSTSSWMDGPTTRATRVSFAGAPSSPSMARAASAAVYVCVCARACVCLCVKMKAEGGCGQGKCVPVSPASIASPAPAVSAVRAMQGRCSGASRARRRRHCGNGTHTHTHTRHTHTRTAHTLALASPSASACAFSFSSRLLATHPHPRFPGQRTEESLCDGGTDAAAGGQGAELCHQGAEDGGDCPLQRGGEKLTTMRFPLLSPALFLGAAAWHGSGAAKAACFTSERRREEQSRAGGEERARGRGMPPACRHRHGRPSLSAAAASLACRRLPPEAKRRATSRRRAAASAALTLTLPLPAPLPPTALPAAPRQEHAARHCALDGLWRHHGPLSPARVPHPGAAVCPRDDKGASWAGPGRAGPGQAVARRPCVAKPLALLQPGPRPLVSAFRFSLHLRCACRGGDCASGKGVPCRQGVGRAAPDLGRPT